MSVSDIGEGLAGLDLSTKTLDYTQDANLIYSRGKNGGVWRVMALNIEEIVSASYDHLAKIWSTKKGLEETELSNVQVLSGHEREVLSLAQLSERVVLTGSADSKVHFWNSTDGSLLGSIKDTQPSGFYSMEVIDENTLATGSCQKPGRHSGKWDHVIKIWDIKRKQFKFSLQGHIGGISEIVNLDGRVIATSSADKTIRVWDLASKVTKSIFKQHLGYVYGLAKLDTKLVSASKDRTMGLFDVGSEKQIAQFSHTEDGKAHSSTVYDVNSHEGNVVASASRDGYVKVWDARSLKCVKTLDPDDGYVYSVNFSPDGKIIAGTSGKIDLKRSKQEQRDNANIVVWDFKRV